MDIVIWDIIIDDSILLADSFQLCEANIWATINLMISLGFVVHPVKSVIVPTKVLVFWGFILNSILMRVRLTPQKIDRIICECQKLLAKNRCKIVELARINYRTYCVQFSWS